MRNMFNWVGIVLLASVSAFAQSDRGTITGTVSDPAAAVVPGATVTIKNTETGAVGQTVTTETGNYTLASLPAGTYDLSIESAGFKKVTQTGIRVQVAQVARINVTLEVGATSDSVTVTAEVPVLKSENAEQSINVTGDRINNLPLNFGGGGGSGGNIRSWTAFAMLSPGVVGNAENNRINGAQSGNYKIIVEGQEVTSENQVTWTSTVSQASVEMIEEFSLQTSNYAPEFGQVSGGLFNFTIKSGTNALHGSGYEYLTNEALDAHRPLNLVNGDYVRPLSRKHDFGFSVTGPVWIPKLYDGRNRTFFSFNDEWFRNRNRASASFQTVPTDAYRNGDFSAALALRPGFSRGTDNQGNAIIDGVVYDLGTNQTINGLVYRQPFAGNIVPKSRMDPVALAVQKLIPEPNNGNGLIQNWIPNNDTVRTQQDPGIKIDHSFNSQHKMSFYYSKQYTDQVTASDGLPFPISAIRVQAIYGTTARLNYDYSVTPTLLIHLGTGYLRFHNPDSSPAESLEYDAVGGIGFNGSVTNPSGFPRISGISDGNYGGMGLGMGPTNANKYYDGKWSAVASATYIRGSHSFKLGGEYQINSWTDRNTRGAQGILSFGNGETGPSTATSGKTLATGQSGLGYASFLLGYVNNASVNAVQDPQWRGYKAGLYVQDDWKVNRKLTVNYGLRWDISTQGHEIWYRNSMFGPSIVNPNAGGRLGGIVYEGFGQGRCNCNFVNPYPYAIGPRLSGAYQIDEKTVLRAGIGVIYGNLGQLSYLTNAQIQGVGINQQQFNNPGNGLPAVYMKNGLQFDLAELYKPTLDPGLLVTPGAALNGGPASTEDPNGARPPRVVQFNVSLQREVAKGVVVEGAYVANRSVWLNQNNLVSPNALTQDRLASCMARLARVLPVDTPYHVTQRGNARQIVFHSDADRIIYLDLLRANSQNQQLSLAGYCLMSNHVHLIVIPRRPQALPLALKHTHGRYATYFNVSRASSGHVWQGRYYSCPLDTTHFWSALRYTELNPVRAGMVEDPAEYAWSSAAAHCGLKPPEPWLDMAPFEPEWPSDRWREFLVRRDAVHEADAIRTSTHTGRPLGTPEFVAQLEALLHRKLAPQKGGRPSKDRPDEQQQVLSFAIGD